MYNIIYYLRAKLINFHENTDKEGAKMNILIIFNSIAFSPMTRIQLASANLQHLFVKALSWC